MNRHIPKNPHSSPDLLTEPVLLTAFITPVDDNSIVDDNLGQKPWGFFVDLFFSLSLNPKSSRNWNRFTFKWIQKAVALAGSTRQSCPWLGHRLSVFCRSLGGRVHVSACVLSKLLWYILKKDQSGDFVMKVMLCLSSNLREKESFFVCLFLSNSQNSDNSLWDHPHDLPLTLHIMEYSSIVSSRSDTYSEVDQTPLRHTKYV